MKKNAEPINMAMVDRYKKAGGFIQLLQVIETCGPKKREQLMTIIQQETPKWADALNQKMLSFSKIMSWPAEALMEIIASVNTLALSTALKSLSEEELTAFLNKIGVNERRKIDQQMKEINPSPNEISACLMKVINETRLLIASGSLKMEKVDNSLVIPDDYENLLEKASSKASPQKVTENSAHLSVVSDIDDSLKLDPSFAAVSNGAGSPNELDSLRRKIVELTLQLQGLKKENMIMKDKLDKIKKIA